MPGYSVTRIDREDLLNLVIDGWLCNLFVIMMDNSKNIQLILILHGIVKNTL